MASNSNNNFLRQDASNKTHVKQVSMTATRLDDLNKVHVLARRNEKTSTSIKDPCISYSTNGISGSKHDRCHRDVNGDYHQGANDDLYYRSEPGGILDSAYIMSDVASKTFVQSSPQDASNMPPRPQHRIHSQQTLQQNLQLRYRRRTGTTSLSTQNTFTKAGIGVFIGTMSILMITVLFVCFYFIRLCRQKNKSMICNHIQLKNQKTNIETRKNNDLQSDPNDSYDQSTNGNNHNFNNNNTSYDAENSTIDGSILINDDTMAFARKDSLTKLTLQWLPVLSTANTVTAHDPNSTIAELPTTPTTTMTSSSTVTPTAIEGTHTTADDDLRFHRNEDNVCTEQLTLEEDNNNNQLYFYDLVMEPELSVRSSPSRSTRQASSRLLTDDGEEKPPIPRENQLSLIRSSSDCSSTSATANGCMVKVTSTAAASAPFVVNHDTNDDITSICVGDITSIPGYSEDGHTNDCGDKYNSINQKNDDDDSNNDNEEEEDDGSAADDEYSLTSDAISTSLRSEGDESPYQTTNPKQQELQRHALGTIGRPYSTTAPTVSPSSMAFLIHPYHHQRQTTTKRTARLKIKRHNMEKEVQEVEGEEYTDDDDDEEEEDEKQEYGTLHPVKSNKKRTNTDDDDDGDASDDDEQEGYL